jgi:hypothetical protein
VSNLFIQFQANKPSLAKLDLIAPVIVDKPSIVRDEIKKCLRFEIKLQAKPDAQVAWFKDTIALKSSNKYKMDLKKESENLFLACLEIYVCFHMFTNFISTHEIINLVFYYSACQSRIFRKPMVASTKCKLKTMLAN